MTLNLPTFRSRTVAALLLILGSIDAAAICTKTPYQVGPADQGCKSLDIQQVLDDTAADGCTLTNIQVSTSGHYYAQAITIQDRNVSITGIASCDGSVAPSSPPALAPLWGNGVQPVITIKGTSSVSLTNLEVTGGTGIAGAGINFNGTGDLTLRNVSAHDNDGSGIYYQSSADGSLTLAGVGATYNHAADGGGIAVLHPGSATRTEFRIVDNPDVSTYIAENHATFLGGGIFVSGNVHMQAVIQRLASLTITANAAGDDMHIGYGGGIYFSGATADIGVAGPAINGNSANGGGGIAVGQSFSNATLNLFSTDPANPNEVSYNTAILGGGIYLDLHHAQGRSVACLYDTNLTANDAGIGGAAVAVQAGSVLNVNAERDADACHFDEIGVPGAVHCNPALASCNVFAQNPPSGNVGTTLQVSTDSGVVSLNRLRLTGAVTSSVIGSETYLANGAIDLSNCVIDHNTASTLLRIPDSLAIIDGCTFADNTLAGDHVIVSDQPLQIHRTIIRESKAVLSYTGPAGSLAIDYLIANETASLPASASVIVADPKFANAAAGNYHLDASSPAIDFAPAGGSTRDFDNRPRDVDWPAIPNHFGPRDLGAFERVPACYQGDVMFCAGFDPYQ